MTFCPLHFLNFKCNLIYLRERCCVQRNIEHSKYLFRFSQTLDFYFPSPLVFKNKVDDFIAVTNLNFNNISPIEYSKKSFQSSRMLSPVDIGP
jgi:hypothetical protein